VCHSRELHRRGGGGGRRKPRTQRGRRAGGAVDRRDVEREQRMRSQPGCEASSSNLPKPLGVGRRILIICHLIISPSSSSSSASASSARAPLRVEDRFLLRVHGAAVVLRVAVILGPYRHERRRHVVA
jgi:hypothetical protein